MSTYHYRDDDVLSPSVVADMFKVGVKTLTTWCNEGKVPYFRTLGGHRRFRWEDIRPLLNSQG